MQMKLIKRILRFFWKRFNKCSPGGLHLLNSVLNHTMKMLLKRKVKKSD